MSVASARDVGRCGEDSRGWHLLCRYSSVADPEDAGAYGADQGRQFPEAKLGRRSQDGRKNDQREVDPPS